MSNDLGLQIYNLMAFCRSMKIPESEAMLYTANKLGISLEELLTYRS